MIVTAGAIDCHVHFICPQLAYEAISSGKFCNWKQLLLKMLVTCIFKYLMHALVCWVHDPYVDENFGRCLRSFHFACAIFYVLKTPV